MKRAVIIALGCKTNQVEGDRLRSDLETCGFEIVEDAAGTDLAVINTCTVTTRSDRRCRQIVHRIARQSLQARVFITGRYAHRAAEEVLVLPGAVASVADKTELVEVIAREEHVALTRTPPEVTSTKPEKCLPLPGIAIESAGRNPSTVPRGAI